MTEPTAESTSPLTVAESTETSASSSLPDLVKINALLDLITTNLTSDVRGNFYIKGASSTNDPRHAQLGILVKLMNLLEEVKAGMEKQNSVAAPNAATEPKKAGKANVNLTSTSNNIAQQRLADQVRDLTRSVEKVQAQLKDLQQKDQDCSVSESSGFVRKLKELKATMFDAYEKQKTVFWNALDELWEAVDEVRGDLRGQAREGLANVIESHSGTRKELEDLTEDHSKLKHEVLEEVNRVNELRCDVDHYHDAHEVMEHLKEKMGNVTRKNQDMEAGLFELRRAHDRLLDDHEYLQERFNDLGGGPEPQAATPLGQLRSRKVIAEVKALDQALKRTKTEWETEWEDVW